MTEDRLAEIKALVVDLEADCRQAKWAEDFMTLDRYPEMVRQFRWLISEVNILRNENHCAGCPTCMGGGP